MAQLAASNQNTILKIREFLGLNENPDGDTHIKTGELSECRNFTVTRDKHLRLRPGQKTTLNLKTAWDALSSKPSGVSAPELSGAWTGTLISTPSSPTRRTCPTPWGSCAVSTPTCCG